MHFTELPPPIVICLVLLVATAAFTDLRGRRIPNWLSGAGVLSGLAVNTMLDGVTGFRVAFSGMLLAFGIYLLLYCLRAMGAGDVKLMAAIGAFTGLGNWFTIFLVTAVVGGVAALFLAVLKRRFQATLWNVSFIVAELIRFRAPYLRREDLDIHAPTAVTLPHAVSIAAGTIACVASTLFR